MNTRMTHWTAHDDESFRYSVMADFVDQIENWMETKGVSQKALAEMLQVTAGRVSQLLGNPGNLTIQRMIGMVRALDLKMTVLVYDDGDLERREGPVNSQFFLAAWEHLGKTNSRWIMEGEEQDAPPSFYIHHVHGCDPRPSNVRRFPVSIQTFEENRHLRPASGAKPSLDLDQTDFSYSMSIGG